MAALPCRSEGQIPYELPTSESFFRLAVQIGVLRRKNRSGWKALEGPTYVRIFHAEVISIQLPHSIICVGGHTDALWEPARPSSAGKDSRNASHATWPATRSGLVNVEFQELPIKIPVRKTREFHRSRPGTLRKPAACP